MIKSMTVAPPAMATLSEQAGSKHCVFRYGDAWFSMPAIAVREIVKMPELVSVPGCHPALVGIAHLRSEFIPVVRVGELLDLEATSTKADCLLVLEGSCTWSLLISESAGLESMETIVSQDSRPENANHAVIGTAMFQNRILRVLNPNGLLSVVQETLDKHWSQCDAEFSRQLTKNK